MPYVEFGFWPLTLPLPDPEPEPEPDPPPEEVEPEPLPLLVEPLVPELFDVLAEELFPADGAGAAGLLVVAREFAGGVLCDPHAIMKVARPETQHVIMADVIGWRRQSGGMNSPHLQRMGRE
jgi:hypothetical protein